MKRSENKKNAKKKPVDREKKKANKKPKKKTVKKQKKNSGLIVLLLWLMLLIIAGVLILILTDLHMKKTISDRIIPEEKLRENELFGSADCILIFGCGVKDNGTPSDMLTDRLKTGLSLYQAGAAPKILVSGDHGREEYDEVNTMKTWLIQNGVPSSDIFMDHAGFSTYESVVRAVKIFGVGKAILVTQGYHQYRALYDAGKIGIEAVGVPADLRFYRGQTIRDLREVLARCKDFLWCIFKPDPTYLGDPIPITGDGDLTNDK